MLKLETPVNLETRLQLPNTPEILGYALRYEKCDKVGFINKFKFKFDSINGDRNSFGFNVVKAPTNRTPADGYIYDLDTAIMIQGVFKWFTEVTPQLHYVYTNQVNGKTIMATALVQKILS